MISFGSQKKIIIERNGYNNDKNKIYILFRYIKKKNGVKELVFTLFNEQKKSKQK